MDLNVRNVQVDVLERVRSDDGSNEDADTDEDVTTNKNATTEEDDPVTIIPRGYINSVCNELLDFNKKLQGAACQADDIRLLASTFDNLCRTATDAFAEQDMRVWVSEQKSNMYEKAYEELLRDHQAPIPRVPWVNALLMTAPVRNSMVGYCFGGVLGVLVGWYIDDVIAYADLQ
jgi:hypothetical protein